MASVPVTSAQIREVANRCGFEIAGVTAATPHTDYARFEKWIQSGKAAHLRYLTDHRGVMRSNPRTLLPTAESIICVGKLYNTDRPFSTEYINPNQGWISRYAWGLDYHEILRPPLEAFVNWLTEINGCSFQSKLCIDTAPLLERSYARAAGLGWIGKNTCLINERCGSWFFLAELLVDLVIEPDAPVPDRCGTCTRCIDACPTNAIVPNPTGGYDVDARLCISYLTIEERGPIDVHLARQHGHHIFGCDICQDVCPWNLSARRKRTDLTQEPHFSAKILAPDLVELSRLTEKDFRLVFRRSPILRIKYDGFLRNVAIAMGNSGNARMLAPLQKLALNASPLVSNAAEFALEHLNALPY